MSEKERQSKIKDGNYYVVQSFMVKELKLKGLELACYAIVYGFSQADDQWFTGSLQYLSDWTCSSKQAVITALKKLVDKKILVKKDRFVNGVKFVEYKAVFLTGGQETLTGGKETSLEDGQETSTGSVKKVDGGSQETGTNTLGDTISNNIIPDTQKDIIDFDKGNDKEARAREVDQPFFENEEEKEKPNFYTDILIKKWYLDADDKRIGDCNEFFTEMHEKYGIQLLTKVIGYFLERFELNGGKDENGNDISSRFAYMAKSIQYNLVKLTANPNDPNYLSQFQLNIARGWGYDV